MKAQCIWCEDSDSQGPRGLYYIHQKCFFEISDMNSSIEYAMKYAKGELPKIKANGDQEGYDNFAKWLQAMSTFQKQWAGVAEKIKKLSALENYCKSIRGRKNTMTELSPQDKLVALQNMGLMPRDTRDCFPEYLEIAQKYSDLKTENINLSERLYAEQSNILESDQKLNTIFHIINSIQKELDEDKQSDSKLKGVFGAEWIQIRVNKLRAVLNTSHEEAKQNENVR